MDWQQPSLTSHFVTCGNRWITGSLFFVQLFGQLRSVCLLSFPLAPLYRVSFCPFLSVGFSYILGVLCTVVSALTALHLVEPEHPLSWSMVAAQAFEPAIILIAWSALYFGIKHYGTVEEQRAELLESEATAREAQLQALRYQLQPHFLFNTLNAISSLVVSKQPERATEMIAKLAALLRNTLSFPEAHVVTLREELAVTEEYLSIEQVRFGPRLLSR
jgi:hypothetical protein